MRVLSPGKPTNEQLKVLAHFRPGYFLVKGAAGSGKTSTALFRLKFLVDQWRNRLDELGEDRGVRIMVLTYNTTLSGYIAALANEQISGTRAGLTISTFGRWVRSLLPEGSSLIDPGDAKVVLRRLMRATSLPPTNLDFYVDEVDYVLGKLKPADLDDYLGLKREGRGVAPRMERAHRHILLDEVIRPFVMHKKERDLLDWNDLAVLAQDAVPVEWDIVVVDEAQDFSANQVRAIDVHLAPEFSATFVMDAMQRIYPRHFAWSEVGIVLPQSHQVTLTHNYRNTVEIAAFAHGLMEGLPLEDDGTMPDFTNAATQGRPPTVLAGKFSLQMDYILNRLESEVDLTSESVAFLHPKGGGFFDYVRRRLRQAGIEFVELTRASSWPQGSEQVALCTIHSAKGLEFDHVVIPGLNQQVTPHGEGGQDAGLDQLRRLLAMGVGRAKKSVIIGYHQEDPSTLVSLMKPDTFELVEL